MSPDISPDERCRVCHGLGGKVALMKGVRGNPLSHPSTGRISSLSGNARADRFCRVLGIWEGVRCAVRQRTLQNQVCGSSSTGLYSC